MPESFADRILAVCVSGAKRMQPGFANPWDRNRIAEWTRQKLLGARRFQLDDDVTRASATLGVQHPEILLQMLRRARTPFPKIWIEWPLHPQLDEAGIVAAPEAPEFVGVLVEALDPGKPIYRMIEIGLTTDGSGQVSVMPFSAVFNLDDPGLVPARRSDFDLLEKATGLDPTTLRQVFVGSGWVGRLGPDGSEPDKAERALRQRQCEELTAHVSYGLTPVIGDLHRDLLTGRYKFAGVDNQVAVYDHMVPVVRQDMRNAVLEFSGTWRIVVAILALMNAHDFVSDHDTVRAGKNRFVGGKIVPFLSHHLVKLRLPRRIVEERMVRQLGEAIPRRRHEVMGHWAESRRRGDPSCQHVYVAETESREACALCGKKRWWVKNHERGTAEIGYVTKDRLVTRT